VPAAKKRGQKRLLLLQRSPCGVFFRLAWTFQTVSEGTFLEVRAEGVLSSTLAICDRKG
jgi:hypothetical protein